MVPLVLHEERSRFTDRQAVFFIDNTVALFSSVKGDSNQKAVSRCAHLSGFLSLKGNIKPWFEFVDSASNWADSISRFGLKCKFCAQHSIPVRQVAVPDWWFTEELPSLYQKIVV